MAIQKGIIKLRGKVGDQVFYNEGGKDRVRSKAKSYTLSEGSKKSGKNFAYVSGLGARIRSAFAPILDLVGDKRIIYRLNGKLVDVLQTVAANDEGERKLAGSNLGLLQHLEFNGDCALKNLMHVLPQVNIVTSNLVISLTNGQIPFLFGAPKGANTLNLKIVLCALALDGSDDEVQQGKLLHIPLSETYFAGKRLELPLPQQGAYALVLGISIGFMEGNYRLMSIDSKAGSILYACQITDGVLAPYVDETANEAPESPTDTDEGLDWDIL
ncbi:MAG: hypothetical protein EOO42_10055 [Flavobacteriales bacterium]|nr:MAG: hypothetical protein EOO42_10055 [Flavobacteriales bacterium]